MSNKPWEEELRIKNIEWIAELITEWNLRPFSGKGSDRSDLIIEITNKHSSFIKEQIHKAKLSVLNEAIGEDNGPGFGPSDIYNSGYNMKRKEIIDLKSKLEKEK